MNITLSDVDFQLDDDKSFGQHFTAFQLREQLKTKPVLGSHEIPIIASRESVIDSNQYYYESIDTVNSQNEE